MPYRYRQKVIACTAVTKCPMFETAASALNVPATILPACFTCLPTLKYAQMRLQNSPTPVCHVARVACAWVGRPTVTRDQITDRPYLFVPAVPVHRHACNAFWAVRSRIAGSFQQEPTELSAQPNPARSSQCLSLPNLNVSKGAATLAPRIAARLAQPHHRTGSHDESTNLLERTPLQHPPFHW